MRGRYLCILLCLYALLPLSAKKNFIFKHVDLNDVFTQPSAISIYQDAKRVYLVWK